MKPLAAQDEKVYSESWTERCEKACANLKRKRKEERIRLAKIKKLKDYVETLETNKTNIISYQEEEIVETINIEGIDRECITGTKVTIITNNIF